MSIPEPWRFWIVSVSRRFYLDWLRCACVQSRDLSFAPTKGREVKVYVQRGCNLCAGTGIPPVPTIEAYERGKDKVTFLGR